MRVTSGAVWSWAWFGWFVASTLVAADLPRAVRGELIVKLREPVSERARVELGRRPGVLSVEPLFGDQRSPRSPGSSAGRTAGHQTARSRRAPDGRTAPDLDQLLVVRLAEGTAVAQAVEDFADDPSVAWAEPNVVVRAQWVPNDPYFLTSGAWGQSYDDLWGLKKIRVEQAWDVTRGALPGGQPIVVAVVDSGLDWTHEDIRDNVWTNPGEIAGNQIDDDHNGFVDDVRGWDFVTCDEFAGCACLGPKPADADPQDTFGHGTHVAGIVAAVADNGLGVAGVAPEAVVMPLRALNTRGLGTTSELAAALRYAVDNGADVINASWGGIGTSRTIGDVVDYASAHGVVVVVAAGNLYGVDVMRIFPANLPGVITVAASNPADDPFDFAIGFSCRGARLDVAAPGIDVLSLRATGTDLYGDGSHVVDDLYYRANGTSMAAPHVAGAVAALLAHRPELTADEVRQVLRSSSATSGDIGDNGWDIRTGFGRLDVASALATPTGPTARINSPANGRVFVNRSSVALTGTAAGPGFHDYDISARRIDQTAWTSVSGPRANPVSGGVLAQWDISGLTDGVYDLRLEARSIDSGGSSARSFDIREAVVLRDAAFKSGWPRSIDDPLAGTSPVSGDLDGNGTQEIVFASRFAIHVYRPGGGLLWRRLYDGALSGPSLADLDGDGRLEVIFEEIGCFGASLHVLEHDGTPRWSKAVPITTGAGVFPPPATTIADVDRDGKLEILVPHPFDQLFVFSSTGKLRQSLLEFNNGGGVAFGDLDGNGTPEILAATVLPAGGTYLHRLTWDKLQRRLVEVGGKWPVEVASPSDPTNWGASYRGPILVDLDRDGVLEVVMPMRGKLHVLRADGRRRSGWPVSLDRQDDIGLVAAGDLDGDQRPELVMGTWASGVYIFRANGSFARFHPQYGDAFESSPVVADVDGDGRGEAILNATGFLHHGLSDGLGRVYAIDYDPASKVYRQLWSKSTTRVAAFEDVQFFSPVVGYLDRNAQLDLFVPSPLYTGSHLMAWELPGGTPKKPPAWPMLGHDARHTHRF